LLSVFIVRLAVLGSLTSRQVNQQELTCRLSPFFMHFDLADGVAATWSVVGFSGMGSTDTVAETD